MKLIIRLSCLLTAAFLAQGVAVAEETSVVYKSDGRSGYHVQRVTKHEPTTMAVYPERRNVEIVVTFADQKVGSRSGSRGRSGYYHASRAID